MQPWCDSVALLKWDGCHLPEASVCSVWEHEGTNYAILSQQGNVFPVLLTTDHKKISVICDECKSLFNLSKVGSHTIRRGGLLTTVMRLEHSADTIVWDVPLNRLEKNHPLFSNKDFLRNVDMLLAYKDVMGIVSNCPSNIRVRRCLVTGEVYPVSYREYTISMLRPPVGDETRVICDPTTLSSRKMADRLFSYDTYSSLMGWKEMQSRTKIYNELIYKTFALDKLMHIRGEEFVGLPILIIERMSGRLHQGYDSSSGE